MIACGRMASRVAVRPHFPPRRIARWLRKLLQPMIKGDAVIYRRDPMLFGLMTVYLERPDGRIVCALASPERLAEAVDRFVVVALEIFDAAELEHAAPPETATAEAAVA